MYCYEMGAVISELRKRAGLSQEELAFDICTPGTISKIERGIQMPSKGVLDEILIKLQRDSIFFTGFLSRDELSAITSWETLLFMAKGGRNPVSDYEEQLFSYVIAIDRREKNVDSALILDEFKEALSLSVKEANIFSVQEKYFTGLELHIINSIAVQYYYLGELKKCVMYLEMLRNRIDKRASRGENLSALMASVLNNSSAALLATGDALNARKAAEKGIALCIKEGFMPPLVSLYKNLSKSFLIVGMHEEAELTKKKVYFFKDILSNREPIKPSDMMQQPYLVFM
ncbi:MAG: helix-turn-helix transcriptional regulator [Lachnospiraceae bacterium]|nr:helix-turn-helix transcriptional regulator [Lachnospiraceae bacterium]